LNLPLIWRFDIGIIYFSQELGSFLACLTLEENTEMPESENYRLMMDYEYQEKNKEIY
jgi:hypothetical protein